MKKLVSITIMVSLILAFSFNGNAQINRTVNTKVADALAQVPTKDYARLNALMSEMADLKEEGLALITAKIIPPGTGDDVAARFVVASLAKYVSQFGKEKDKRMVERGLQNALKTATDKDIQSFYLTQLYFVATPASVSTLSQYLQDDQLCDASVKVLLAIATPSVGKAMLNAFENARGIPAMALAKAFGQMKMEAATEALNRKLDGADPKLQRVILESIGLIGSKTSFGLLTEKASKAQYLYEPTGAVNALLTYANRLGEKWNMDLCDKVLIELMSNCKDTKQLQFRSAALALKVKYWGVETLPLLKSEFDHADKAYRAGVLNLAAGLLDISATRQWINKAVEESGEKRAEIVEMLGRKGDPALLPALQLALTDTSSDAVRLAAIEAIANIKDDNATKALEGYLLSGQDATATAKALSRKLDAAHLNRLSAALETAPKSAKVEIIRLIGAKAVKSDFAKILAYTNNADQDLSVAAFAALKNLSSEENIPVLLDLLKKASSKEQIFGVQQSLINATSRLNELEKTKFISQLSSAADPSRTLDVLSRLGNREALTKVVEAFGSKDQSVKEAAFSALLKWSSADAADALYQICSADKTYQAKAFKGFTDLVSRSALPDDQKLLQYRKLMTLAANKEQKLMVIDKLGDLKTFITLVYVSKYLDDKDLKFAAASAVMQVALPGSGKTTGLTGEIVKNALTKSLPLIKGAESDYDKEKIKKYLASMPDEKGFEPMFNGKDLKGWKGLVGNPITRAKMSPEELAAKQVLSNTKATKNWSVKDNSITFNGDGDNLCSEKQYGDFEMIVDWRITKKGDSGIYLRGSPQVQIWDTSRVEVGAQVGSGGLYNNAKYRSTPLKVADNPINDWNHFYIKMIGERVTVYLNGILVVDNVILENYWDRSIPIFPKEAIELQAHGTDLAFRDIYVREISDNRYAVTPEEQKEGFVPLFNGVNFEGWTGNTVDYEVKNGEIVLNIDNGPSHGNLFTQGEYRDFIYRFEFQLTPGANNGLGIRAPLEGDAAYVGMELQILDDDAPVYSQLQPYQYHGSVYGVIPAKRGSLKPTGQWNYEEVVVKGNNVKVILNGNVITDGDIQKASRNGTMDHRDHPGLNRATGHIGFLGHGSVVKFRNIRIKEITPISG
ncbi:MAG: family 16 glycoside hydrolase [Prolixibacteraceae bacterium]